MRKRRPVKKLFSIVIILSHINIIANQAQSSELITLAVEDITPPLLVEGVKMVLRHNRLTRLLPLKKNLPCEQVNFQRSGASWQKPHFHLSKK